MAESGHAALETRLHQLLNERIRQELLLAGDRIQDALRDEIQRSVHEADLDQETPMKELPSQSASQVVSKMKRAGTSPCFEVDDQPERRAAFMFHRKSYAVAANVRKSARLQGAAPILRSPTYATLPSLPDENADQGSPRSARMQTPRAKRGLGSIQESSMEPCDASPRPDIPKLDLANGDQGTRDHHADLSSSRSEAPELISAIYDPLLDEDNEPQSGSKRVDVLNWSPLKLFVQSPRFDRVAGILIVLNAVSIAIETDFMAGNEIDRAPMPFPVVNSVFCAIFTIELALRLFIYGRRFFSMQGAAWNWFDCIVVGTMLCDESLMLVEMLGDDAVLVGMQKKAGAFRILRTFRLFRVVRLARALRLVQELHDIFVAMVKALSALVWTIALLGLLMFVVGVFLTQLVTDYKVHAESGARSRAEGLPPQEQALLDYWGSLHLSIQTLFFMISEGIDWRDASAPVTHYVSGWVMVIFAFYVVFTIFGLLNIVTSVFVEAVIDSRDEGKRNSLAEHLTQVFAGPNLAGVERGTITPEDFQAHLQDAKMRAFLASIDITPEDAHQLFAIVDDHGTGEIPVEDFLSSCMRLQGDAKAVDFAIFVHEYRLCMTRWDNHSRRLESMLRALVEKDVATGQFTPRSVTSPR